MTRKQHHRIHRALLDGGCNSMKESSPFGKLKQFFFQKHGNGFIKVATILLIREVISNLTKTVTPAQAGVQNRLV
jgi:hypothetical protein